MKRQIILVCAVLCAPAFAQLDHEDHGHESIDQGPVELPEHATIRRGSLDASAFAVEVPLFFLLKQLNLLASLDDGRVPIISILSDQTGVSEGDIAKFLIDDVPATFEQLEADKKAARARYCYTPLESSPSEHAARMSTVKEGYVAAQVEWARTVEALAPNVLWEHLWNQARAKRSSVSSIDFDYEGLASKPGWSAASFRATYCRAYY